MTKQAAKSSRFFLTKLSTYEITSEYCDLHLSDYKLDHPDAKKVIEAASSKRIVTIDDCVLLPDYGEGMAHIDGNSLRVTYAWKGLSENDVHIGRNRYDTVLGWSVRVEPETKGKKFRKLMEEYAKSIYFEEGGKEEVLLPKKEWYKIVCAFGNPPTLAGYRKTLERFAEYYWKEGARDLMKKQSPKLIKSTDKIQSPEGIQEAIDRVRGKKKILFPIIFTTPREIEPWKAIKLK